MRAFIIAMTLVATAAPAFAKTATAAAVSRLKKRIARALFSGISEDEARAATQMLAKAGAGEKDDRTRGV